MDSGDDSDLTTLPPTPIKDVAPLPSNALLPLKIKRRKELTISIPNDLFVSYHADLGAHNWRFKILPTNPCDNRDNCSSKLTDIIQRGGGAIENVHGTESLYTIKILDLDLVRMKIQQESMRKMELPNDCFSSNFIWSCVYQSKTICGTLLDVDLNRYRLSPSIYSDYNANQILKGSLAWGNLKLESSQLYKSITIKDVALQYFPELLLNKRQRTLYTRQESQLLLDKVCELQAHSKINTLTLYKELSQNHFSRTSFSLREHFRKTILPHIMANDGYYLLSADDFRKFETRMRQKLQQPLSAKSEVPGIISAPGSSSDVTEMDVGDSLLVAQNMNES